MEQLIIERTFDAPIEKVWDAFTNPEILKMWWAPPAMQNSFLSADVKEGGLFRYCFKMDEGGDEFWGRGIYAKLDKPNYLSYKDCFTDNEGNDVPSSYYGMTDSRSEEINEIFVEFFFSVDGEHTLLKMVGENPFDEQMTRDMTDGWNGMFNNLVNTLK